MPEAGEGGDIEERKRAAMLGTVMSYRGGLQRYQSQAAIIRSNALSRMVWFVAIAGYVMFNGKPFLDAIRCGPTLGKTLLVLSLPWAVAAVMAVISHFLMDEASAIDVQVHEGRLAVIDVLILKIQSGRARPEDVVQMLDDKEPNVAREKARLKRWGNAAKWAERATFALLLLCFAWSVVGGAGTRMKGCETEAQVFPFNSELCTNGSSEVVH